MELTFAFSVQLNDNEDFIKEGTVLKVSNNPYYLKRFEDATPVIITEAYTHNGEKITGMHYTEWFSNETFVELKSYK